MWARSNRFDTAVKDTHDVAFSCSLWSPGQKRLLADSLEIDGGSITVSETAAHRRAGTVNIVDRDGTLADIFSSRRTVPPVELAISRGIAYPDGTRELIPLGVLVAATVDPELRTKYAIGVHDRSRRVARNAFWRTYVIPAGTSYIQAIRDLVADRLRYDVDVQIATSNEFVTLGPIVHTERDDPWKAVQALAASIGCEVYFDQIGRLIIRDRVLAMGSPDWRYDGTNSRLLPETRVAVADEPGYNAVLAVGESSGNTTDVPRALAVDSDPTSPTYWNGDEYGQVTEIYSDSSIADVDHAALVARTRLAHWLGRNDAMTAATVPHPAHDAGDVLATTWLGVDRTVAIASLTMPLDVGTAATLTCRSQIALEAA